MVIKAGRLTSAFGAFPLHYDDADNPLLDQPLSYVQTLALRHDQLPCGVEDLAAAGHTVGIWQSLRRCSGLGRWLDAGEPLWHCRDSGGVLRPSRRRAPASDQRFAFESTEFEPRTEYAQWAAGGGFTILQGFRVGVSGFRGPYLDPFLAAWLPAGATVRDFPASGLGVDVQWARGHWSVGG